MFIVAWEVIAAKSGILPLSWLLRHSVVRLSGPGLREPTPKSRLGLRVTHGRRPPGPGGGGAERPARRFAAMAATPRGAAARPARQEASNEQTHKDNEHEHKAQNQAINITTNLSQAHIPRQPVDDRALHGPRGARPLLAAGGRRAQRQGAPHARGGRDVADVCVPALKYTSRRACEAIAYVYFNNEIDI